jgi:deoxyribodipyrimidine photo-lyase
MHVDHPVADRQVNVLRLRELLSGLYVESPAEAEPGAWRGGRSAALEKLHQYDVRGYAAQRNYVEAQQGRESRLSPYLRHGMLSLEEVARWVGSAPCEVGDRLKFWAELGWRQFWQLVRRGHGDRIYENMEDPKVEGGSVHANLPEDIARGRTGLACMDGFVEELRGTGWLHNHARMWLASYVIHVRKVDWKAGERFFYQHLLDGDPASNALSWQWVASTFSHKPYIFNRENLERYTHGHYCRQCTAACPFEGSYESLERRWFGRELPRGR